MQDVLLSVCKRLFSPPSFVGLAFPLFGNQTDGKRAPAPSPSPFSRDGDGNHHIVCFPAKIAPRTSPARGLEHTRPNGRSAIPPAWLRVEGSHKGSSARRDWLVWCWLSAERWGGWGSWTSDELDEDRAAGCGRGVIGSGGGL
ncbi:hypothetical protein B0T14DRAFT_37249 [Immersiella caudata]|uniref:Uncharacterized protein n=1 Tax=Immersiella caudata TaxID=314043 RepID=A0AA39XEN3_9PEZI|nr:hypothetical protein B0T14DRAFT_37249 [Immersiella caudata]